MGILGADMTRQDTNQGKSIFAAGVAVAGWAVPGLGHALIGERVRGIVLCVVILATYWIGTAIGGAMTVDARYDKWWSYAQLGSGVSGAYGWMRQDNIYKNLEADEERCGGLIEQSLAMCTSLAPIIGYDDAAAIAKEAFKTGQTVREVALEKKVLSKEMLDKALNAASMTEPSA